MTPPPNRPDALLGVGASDAEPGLREVAETITLIPFVHTLPSGAWNGKSIESGCQGDGERFGSHEGRTARCRRAGKGLIGSQIFPRNSQGPNKLRRLGCRKSAEHTRCPARGVASTARRPPRSSR